MGQVLDDEALKAYEQLNEIRNRIISRNKETLLGKYLSKLGVKEGIEFLAANAELLVPAEHESVAHKKPKIIMTEEQLNTFAEMTAALGRRNFFKATALAAIATITVGSLSYRQIRDKNMTPAEDKVTRVVARGGLVSTIVVGHETLHGLLKDGLYGIGHRFIDLFTDAQIQDRTTDALRNIEPQLKQLRQEVRYKGPSLQPTM